MADVVQNSDGTIVGIVSEDTNEVREKNVDEIDNIVNSQFVTATDSFWRICGFDVHGRDPSIQRLTVHEENLQIVTFNEENPREAVSNPKNTTLLGWFNLNQSDPDAKQLKYHEIPEHYIWTKVD